QKNKPSADEDYNDLKKLVGDIKNGKFNDDQISLNDFKNSVAYQDADENMQDCINLAAKIGHNLGDNEIVHCFDNTNYFKNKYPNVSVPKAKVPQPESKPRPGPEPKAKPSAAEDYNDLKKLVGDIKNGKFNDDQISLNDFKNSVAYQDADENMQDCINLAAKIGHNLGDNEIVHCFDNTNYFKDKYPNVSVPKAKVPQPESKPEPGPEPKAKPSAAEDYNDLKKLVGDIKNGKFNDDQISLNDFKNSVAYQDADENMQDCINLAAKIGHNLGDNEIVHCFDNTNYFKDKYSNVNVNKAKVPQPESKPEPGPEPKAKPSAAEDYNDLKKLVGDIKNGKFNDDQISLNDFKNSVAYQDADENMQDCINLAAKIGHNLGDNEIVHCFDNTNYF